LTPFSIDWRVASALERLLGGRDGRLVAADRVDHGGIARAHPVEQVELVDHRREAVGGKHDVEQLDGTLLVHGHDTLLEQGLGHLQVVARDGQRALVLSDAAVDRGELTRRRVVTLDHLLHSGVERRQLTHDLMRAGALLGKGVGEG
jgi:hypothetical protein